MNNLPHNNLLSIKEAAKLLNVSIDTVRRWEKSGRIKSIRTKGGHRRYTHEGIDNAKNKTESPINIGYQTITTPTSRASHYPVKNILKFGLVGLTIYLLIFRVSKTTLIDQFIPFLEQARGKVEEIVSKTGISQIFNNNYGLNTGLKETNNPTSAVLAESSSKDLSFDVNIDSRFRGNLGVDGSATISGTLTANNFTTTGNITGQTLTSTGAVTGGTGVFTGNITVPGIVTNATTVNLLNTNATTLNLGGAATTISLGAVSGTTTVNNDLKVSGAFTSSGKLTASGDLAVSGTLTASGALNVSGATALSGNLTKINGVTYSWPTTQGAASTLLRNDGTGTLTWTASTTNLGSVTGVLAIANGGTNNSTAYTAGSVIFSDGTKLTQDNTNLFWNTTTGQLRIGSGGAVIPSVNLGADLGTTALRWNNIYVGTVNSNSTLSTTGQALFTYSPTDTTYGQSSVQINPTTAPANSFLLGLGIAGAQMAGIDAEGDLTLGYSGGAGTSAPNNANPLSLYNHGATNVALIDTSGDLRLGSAAVTANTGVLNVTGAYTGKALAIFNETGDQNIFTASASGITKLSIDRSGDIVAAAGAKWQPITNSTTALNIANAAGTAFAVFDTTNSRLGLGAATAPNDTLDITGNATMSGTLGFKAIFSTDVPTCNATAKGKIYFDGQRNQHYFCNGTNWRSLVGLQDQNRQDITTNSLVHNQIVRKGWNYQNLALNTDTPLAFSFGITFDDIPIVVSALAGMSASAPSNLSGCTQITGNAPKYGIYSISATGFTADFNGSGSGGFAAGNYCVTWIAHGTFAAGADLAEYYRSTEQLEAGDVVSISKSEDKKVNKSSGSYDRNAIGIVSTQPGQVLEDENGKSTQSDAYPIALAGRVPLKVSLEGGIIQRGDPLTTSSIPGVAMKATGPGPIIGKAMERFDGTQTISTSNTNTSPSGKDDPDLQQLDHGVGKIIVFINNTWWEPNPQPNQLTLTIPNINNFSDGDFLMPYISKKDNSPIALFTKFSDVKTTLFNSEILQLTNLKSEYQTVANKNQENTNQIQDLSASIASVSAQLANIESDIQLLKSTQLVATTSGNVLGSATDSASLTNLFVLKNTILGDTVVNGKLNIGTLTIDNTNNSIDAVGTLKIQALALDSIQFEGGSIEMDKNGNLKINKGVVVGNDQMRGSVILTANHNTVDIIPTTPWSSPPKSIIITPSFITSSAVVRLETTGATVEVGQTSSQDQKIYWVAIW